MMFVQLLACLLSLFAVCHVLAAPLWPPPWVPPGEQITGPASPQDAPEWRAQQLSARKQFRASPAYNDTLYTKFPPLRWCQTSYIQPQMMVHDRFFFDSDSNNYTIARYVKDVSERYGGIDSVLVWHSYPNIGIDNRNQFDMLADLPGGLAGISRFIAEFHAHGIRVLFPYNPWDTGTQRPPGNDSTVLASLWTSVGADGFNGDTMTGIPKPFFAASVAKDHPLVLEPEVGSPLEDLAWTPMSWGYWAYPRTPSISRYKWMYSQHMVNVCNRWAVNKTDDLQAAFFNGVGYVSWENVWGIWNGIAPRYEALLRRMASILRFGAFFLNSPQWFPYDGTAHPMLFASRWPMPLPGGKLGVLWTLVNRAGTNISGPVLNVTAACAGGTCAPSMAFYDLYHGHVLGQPSSGLLTLSVEAGGIGAVLALPANSSYPYTAAQLKDFLLTMQGMSQRALASFSAEPLRLVQQMTPVKPTVSYAHAPEGMQTIPACQRYDFVVQGIEIEGGNQTYVDVQFPWESVPFPRHNHTLSVASFALDKFPVTNAAFAKLLRSGYVPDVMHNFLRSWHRQGAPSNWSYPSGWGQKPVTWVSLEDARAFCRWAGKRLPNAWEWQLAAEGCAAHNTYPWGNEWNASNVPQPERGPDLRPLDDVGAHPGGASVYGVQDMVATIWQWTNEFTDAHTRAATLRGGSFYQPQGSHWYFPQAYPLRQHGKYLLMSPSLDRAATLGFRCAADLGPSRL